MSISSPDSRPASKERGRCVQAHGYHNSRKYLQNRTLHVFHRQTDGRGRLLAIEQADIVSGKAQFSFEAGNVILTSVATVEVDAIVGGTRSDRNIAEFFVPRSPHWDDYTLATQFVGPYSGIWEDQAARLAIDARIHLMMTYGLNTDNAGTPKVFDAQYLRPFVDAGKSVIDIHPLDSINKP